MNIVSVTGSDGVLCLKWMCLYNRINIINSCFMLNSISPTFMLVTYAFLAMSSCLVGNMWMSSLGLTRLQLMSCPVVSFVGGCSKLHVWPLLYVIYVVICASSFLLAIISPLTPATLTRQK